MTGVLGHETDGPRVGKTGWPVRFVASVLLDLFDLTLGRAMLAPGSGEILGALVALALWGPRGLLYLLELADPTEQFDGFMPTATLIAISARKDYVDAWF